MSQLCGVSEAEIIKIEDGLNIKDKSKIEKVVNYIYRGKEKWEIKHQRISF